MNQARHSCPIALIKDRFILAAGGNTEIQKKNYTNTTEIYDIESGLWIQMNSMDKPRANTSMSSFNDRHIFIF